MCVTHQAQAGIAPGRALKVFHHLPVQGGVTGQNVLPVLRKQFVERPDDAFEVGPSTLEHIQRFGA